jgi:hypothetical protein
MIRVLMVLADTDRTDANLSAIDLHGVLVGLGFEVRTIALGPGRTGGLASLVPVISPGPRSLAAHLELRREQAWADVVVAHGLAAARVAQRAGPRRAVPVVAVLGDDLFAADGIPPSARRVLGAAARVVATDVDTFAALADGLSPRVLLPFGVEPGAPVTDAQRRAARGQLALPVDGPVLWWVGAPGPRAPGHHEVAEEAARRGWPLLEGGGDDDELVSAAADVAVLGPGAVAGPPRELLRAAAAGCALVAPAAVADGGLVDASTGSAWPPADPPAAGASLGSALEPVADGPWRHSRGAAARARVQERFGLADCGARWADLLGSLVPPSSPPPLPPGSRD